MKRAFMAAMKASVLEILVYDEIGENFWTGGGITPSSVAQAIQDAGAFSSITLRINSPGGSAFDGVAIYNLLRAQKKPIAVFVDGIAASAASVVAMAGDTINMGTGATLMIHNAMWGCYGDAQVLRAAADVIEGISVTIGEIYVKRTGMKATEVKTLMDAETWLNGEQAVEQGFATGVTEQDEEQIAQARALAKNFNLKMFQHAPNFANDVESVGTDKDNSKLEEARNESVDPDCECECTPCRTIGCSGCENDPCEAIGCDCPNHEEMSSEFTSDLETYKQRLTLRERAA